MPMSRYEPEQVVTLLRQIEVAIAIGLTRFSPVPQLFRAQAFLL